MKLSWLTNKKSLFLLIGITLKHSLLINGSFQFWTCLMQILCWIFGLKLSWIKVKEWFSFVRIHTSWRILFISLETSFLNLSAIHTQSLILYLKTRIFFIHLFLSFMECSKKENTSSKIKLSNDIMIVLMFFSNLKK